ncbi:MAG: pyridoxine 5'-phosphate synthase [Desulfonatronovibrionaceae bacterium]
MPALIVNVDHIATLRQARLGKEPDPVTAAHIAELSGADGIIVHLREDRRHIQDRDVFILGQTLKTGLHLEMAATGEMQGIALEVRPHMVCLVPEKREELTTEGGLDCASRIEQLRDFIRPFFKPKIKTSLFIDAEPEQIEAATAIGADYIEIHTGHFADAQDQEVRLRELDKIKDGVQKAQASGLRVNLGHGLDYHNIKAFADTPGIHEYSIGHSIISRAALVGMDKAVSDMAALISGFVD